MSDRPKKNTLSPASLDAANIAVHAFERRDGHAGGGSAKRLLILGLDGATFDALDPLMDEGRMPRLREAVQSGASGVLRSTTPPITPAAWTTFLTGRQPGSHGILDFERYDPTTNQLSMNSTRCLGHVRNLWQILGDAGLCIGSVNVPMTYPATPVNGFMVSGFETPGPQSDFAYPPSLKSDILSRWPDPTLRSQWKRKTFGGDARFRKNIDYMERSFHQGAGMSMWLGERFGWDVLMVVLKLVDNLQHKTWKYIDPRWANRRPRRRDMVRHAFSELDRAVGSLLDYAAQRDATVLMVSDHGHGSLDGKVQPNLLLTQWGYLKLRRGGAQKVTRARHLWDRSRGRTGKFQPDDNITTDLAVDFSRTTACVMHAGMAGFLYINLKGRQPTGIVDPGDYDRMRDGLIARFLGDECRVRDPGGSTIPLFTEVHKPEELYGCSRADQPWMPDLILVPRDGLAAIRKIRGHRAVRWLPYRKIEGTHRPEGILIASGPGIAQRSGLRAHIVDCAPTILALLGQPVPADMEGRVISELFQSPPEVVIGSAHAPTKTVSASQAYSARELQEVTERLSDLGYLE